MRKTSKNLWLALLGVGLFTTGAMFNRWLLEYRVEPWNEGLVRVKCAGAESGTDLEFVARGLVVYQIGDSKEEANITVSPAWDPITMAYESDRKDIDPAKYGLGCFVFGLTHEEIKARSNEQRLSF